MRPEEFTYGELRELAIGKDIMQWEHTSYLLSAIANANRLDQFVTPSECNPYAVALAEAAEESG
ncbi:MAG: hypothetical protein KF777_15795 [Planctomycetaceae bacterium]|nr:hypothetical protein [Planctomycetaceae bacterium]